VRALLGARQKNGGIRCEEQFGSSVLVCAATFCDHRGNSRPEGSGYHLLKKVTLGGEGGWGYLSVDPCRTTFIFREARTSMVVDSDGKVLGDIPDLKGTHGAQIVPDLGRGFSSNGRSNQ